MLVVHPIESSLKNSFVRKMSDCCFMLQHEIRAGNDGRSKRPREQHVAIGMEITNNESKTTVASNSGGSKNNMDEEFCSRQDTELSEGSSKESDKDRNSPKQVTDDSCESEGCSLQENSNARQPQHLLGYQHKENKEGNGKQDENKGANVSERRGSVMEDDQQSSVSVSRGPTLPQHERIQKVEPLDINYRSTPAYLRLRESLLSRLRLVAPTGRIQVVSSCFCNNILFVNVCLHACVFVS